MKNLELFRSAEVRVDEKLVRGPQFVCVDTLRRDVYLYDDGSVYSVCMEGDVDCLKSVQLDGSCGEVRACSYNTALDALCLVTASGDVLTVRNDHCEVVGSVGGGVVAAQWSPDEELLLLVSGEGSVLAMSLSFYPMWETSLWNEVFGEQAFVTVGWGRKETQFHGKEGKAAATTSNGDSQDTLDQDTSGVSISWRGDGTLVAVSATKPAGCRAIRIFSREGVLQATSEDVPGLRGPIAWKPLGSLLASTQRLPHVYQVVFFEKNGLRHGEFSLPYAPDAIGEVRQLAWSPGSDVLAVWYETPDSDQLFLCSVSNYHWYIKQTFFFPPEKKLWAWQWDVDEPLHMLMAWGSPVCLADVQWRWVVHRSSHGLADVAVLDNNQVLLTNFSQKVIPPPMCDSALQLPCAVNQVAFAPHGDVCVALSDGHLAFFGGADHILRKTVKVPRLWEQSPVGPQHLVWLNHHTLLCVGTRGTESELLRIDPSSVLSDSGANGFLDVTRVDIPVGSTIVSLVPVGDGEVLLHTSDLNLLWIQGFSSPEDVPEMEPLNAAPESLSQIYAFAQPEKKCGKRGLLVVGVGERSGRLYVDGREVLAGVTSMIPLPSGLLLVSTTAHQLLCLTLHSQEPEAILKHAVCRRVERGSRLVSVSGSRVVLQMPRGNLETVTPRALVLREVIALLDAHRFSDAFLLMRRQRIDLNLLVDHNPSSFLLHCELLVREVEPQWLQLLVAEVRDEDTTSTTYADVYRQQSLLQEPQKQRKAVPWGKTAEGKRVSVCHRLQEALQAVETEVSGKGRAELLIARAVAAAASGDLEAALALCREAPNRDLSLDNVLRPLLTLATPSALFDAALALGDLTLASQVALRVGRDPKEFLPFLNELRCEEEPFRSFRIASHLGRWRSALAHLAKCSSSEHFERFLTVAKERGLLAYALTLLEPQNERHRAVAAAYGQSLFKERRLEEAAVILRRAGCTAEALEAARQAGNWTQALELLELLTPTPEERLSQIQALSGVLAQQRRFAEAARVLTMNAAEGREKSSSLIEQSVKLLCQGRLWAEARLAAVQAGRKDLLDSDVNSECLEQCERLREEVSGLHTSYDTHLQRLTTVREERALRLLREHDEPCPEGDLFSDTSSSSGGALSSRSTSYSGRSATSASRSRRKQERKLMSLKPGSPWEPLALLRAMHQEASALLALRKEVRSVCLALVAADQDTPAAKLQQHLNDALILLEQSQAEVWPPALTAPQVPGEQEKFGPEATADSIVSGSYKLHALVENCELLEPQFRIPPQSQDHINWKLSILNTEI